MDTINNSSQDHSSYISSSAYTEEESEELLELTTMDLCDESLASCNCKSQCCVARKPGSDRGCECKRLKRKCTEKCKCGTAKKPCKNQVSQSSTTTTAEVAFQRETPIRDLLRDMSLTTEEMFKLVAHSYSDNRNRLKDIVSELRHCNIDQPGPLNCSGTSTNPSFCHCNYCQEMPTVSESKCCMQSICRSLTLVFKNICLDRENIQTAIRNLADTFVFTPMYENKAMRHAAYRQYVMWQHGHLGSGRRIVIPSCCVWAIRNLYPSPTGVYTGFIPSRRITMV